MIIRSITHTPFFLHLQVKYNIIPTMSDLINKISNAIVYPNDKPDLSHNPRHGANNMAEAPDQAPSLLERITGEHGSRQIKAQGNTGVGMEEGLQQKAIAQQERVAERSRLRDEGLFEPHTTHDKLVNHTEEHREVADGSRMYAEDGSLKGDVSKSTSTSSSDSERLV